MRNAYFCVIFVFLCVGTSAFAQKKMVIVDRATIKENTKVVTAGDVLEAWEEVLIPVQILDPCLFAYSGLGWNSSGEDWNWKHFIPKMGFCLGSRTVDSKIKFDHSAILLDFRLTPNQGRHAKFGVGYGKHGGTFRFRIPTTEYMFPIFLLRKK